MFKKGESGNPAGRPKERITTNKELKNLFKEMLSENTNGIYEFDTTPIQSIEIK